MGIEEFLLERIAEDWAVAQSAINDVRPEAELWMGYALSDNAYPSVRDHVQKWTPSRVLAECEAKRRFVEEWQRVRIEHLRAFHSEPPIPIALHAIAAVYADHPDYRQGWR